MWSVKHFACNPFVENTYVVWNDAGEALVVDAGCYSPAEKRELTEWIRAEGLRPVLAVCTHGHIDHILGVEYIKQAFGIEFALHRDDRFLVESAATHASIYGFELDAVPAVERDLAEMECVAAGLQIIHTPGHTPGHVCFYDPEAKLLLTGDTLFRESIGRTDLPGGDYSWIMRSILDRIMPLGGDVRIYPGHGLSSTLGHEALYNPFITEVLNSEVVP